MLRLCLVFLKSEPHYAYKRYAHKRKIMNCNKMLLKLRIGSAESWALSSPKMTIFWKIGVFEENFLIFLVMKISLVSNIH